ncbi:MAG: ferrous iron transport protein A [Peptococcaceae bacterium]|nr:ferrous iron transport protein A [Peptococcaceae bacterium]
MRMSDLRKGDVVIIKGIKSDLVRAQAIRFGISEGNQVCVEEVLPKGPIVLRRGLMRYALGRNLTEQIIVEKAKVKKHG